MGDLWFVTGGARSGKSRFAARLAARTGAPVVFIATMEPGDDELRRRIARHRADRPTHWTTVEAPLSPVEAVSAAAEDACVLIDCLSLWVSNRLLQEGEDASPEALAALSETLRLEVRSLAAAAAARAAPTIAVSNEVGGGVVPATPLGRVYRDLLGEVNQEVARAATRAWLLVAGRALELPPDED